jgi:hypothetical protein
MAAIKLANTIDSNSINLLKKYCFVKRGDLEFWLRVSPDSSLYSFSYKLKGDTVEMGVYQPMNFVKDFHSTLKFDTSIYGAFRFYKLKDIIVRLVADSNYGGENSRDTLVNVKGGFPEKDPFATLATLTAIKDKFGFIGTSYRSDIGDFVEFWLSPQFKLTYLPDTLKMNPKAKKYWLDDFAKGKQIKEHWALLKVYER